MIDGSDCPETNDMNVSGFGWQGHGIRPGFEPFPALIAIVAKRVTYMDCHRALVLILAPAPRHEAPFGQTRSRRAAHRGVRRTTLATCRAPATRATRTEVPPLVCYTIARHRPMSAGIDSTVRFYGEGPHYLVGVPYRLLSSIG